MNVTTNAKLEWVVSGPGARRRILATGAELMMVEFHFDKDGVGELHSHPHVQTTYIQSGKFRFTVAGVEHLLEPGDALFIPSGAEHSCVALEEGTLIDAFTPVRQDFLQAHGITLG